MFDKMVVSYIALTILAKFVLQISELGIVHRMTSFEYPSMMELFDLGYKQCNIFQPFRDTHIGTGLQRLIDQGRFPYYTEGAEYFAIVHEFVTEWLAAAGNAAGDSFALAFYEALVFTSKGQQYELPPYSPDNMADVIAQLIFAVTAYHEIVGTIVVYTQSPSYAGFRAVQDAVETDTESFLLAAYLTGLTGLRMPLLMREFPNYFGKGEGIPEWEIYHWANFQENLVAQVAAVEVADAARIAAGQPEFKIMNPAHFECAISV
jgi:hypothetical protein